MQVPFRTFAVFSLAFGMLAAGYLLAPAPGATQLPPSPAPVKAAGAAPASKPVATLVASRAPVPLAGPRHSTYFETAAPAAAPGDKPAADGTPDAAQPQTAALATDQAAGSGVDSEARRAIEFDGYRNVRDIVKGSDGSWHARAMRGRTEITVTVDATGNVSAE